MKIVIQYDSGDYDSFTNHVLCFNYESTEAFLVDFETALKARKLAVDEFREKAMNHKLGQNYPDYVSGTFTFCNQEFEIFDFFIDKELVLPEVYELEEWFERSVNEEH